MYIVSENLRIVFINTGNVSTVNLTLVCCSEMWKVQPKSAKLSL